MANNSVRFDSREWDKFFAALGRGYKPHVLLRAAFAVVGFKDVIQHYKDEMGPDGKWEPRKASTNKRYDQISGALRNGNRKITRQQATKKFGGVGEAYARGFVPYTATVAGVARSAYRSTNKLLVLTGQMRQSLLPGNLRDLDANSVLFYSNDNKSGAHDEGDKSRNLPARSFMWISSKGQEMMAKVILDRWLAGTA